MGVVIIWGVCNTVKDSVFILKSALKIRHGLPDIVQTCRRSILLLRSDPPGISSGSVTKVLLLRPTVEDGVIYLCHRQPPWIPNSDEVMPMCTEDRQTPLAQIHNVTCFWTFGSKSKHFKPHAHSRSYEAVLMIVDLSCENLNFNSIYNVIIMIAIIILMTLINVGFRYMTEMVLFW